MTDVSAISTEEMIDDYYASERDKALCESLRPAAEIAYQAATRDSIAQAHARRTRAHLYERITGNTRIMERIEQELKRRGELHLLTT